MIILHHDIPNASILEELLIIVLCISIGALLMFSVFWLKFKIWSNTRLGQTAMAVNMGLLLLATVEILDLLHLNFRGWIKLPAWIIITITAVIRTMYMLQGRSTLTELRHSKEGDH